MLNKRDPTATLMQKSLPFWVMSEMAPLPLEWAGYMMPMLKLVFVNVLKATIFAIIGSFFLIFAKVFYVGWPPHDWGLPPFYAFDLVFPIMTFALLFLDFVLCFNWSQVPTFWYNFFWILLYYTMSTAEGTAPSRPDVLAAT